MNSLALSLDARASDQFLNVGVRPTSNLDTFPSSLDVWPMYARPDVDRSWRAIGILDAGIPHFVIAPPYNSPQYTVANFSAGISVPELKLSFNPGIQIFLDLQRAQVDAWLNDARQAAKNGNLRAAYHNVYRGFDLLLKNAEWSQIAKELNEVCSDEYPVAFGIGATRFVSSAAQKIPGWTLIIEKLKKIAQAQRKDVQYALRGLITVDAAE